MLLVKLDSVREPVTALEIELMKVARMHLDGTCDVNVAKNGVGCAATLRGSMLDLLPDAMMDLVKIEHDQHDGTVTFSDPSQPTMGRLNIYSQGGYPSFYPFQMTREPFSEVCRAAGMIWRRHVKIDIWDLVSAKYYSYHDGSARRNYGYVTDYIGSDKQIRACFTQGKLVRRKDKKPSLRIRHVELTGPFDWDSAMKAVEAASNPDHYFFPEKR